MARTIRPIYIGFNEDTIKKNLQIWNEGKKRAKQLDKNMSAHVIDLIAEDNSNY